MAQRITLLRKRACLCQWQVVGASDFICVRQTLDEDGKLEGNEGESGSCYLPVIARILY